MSSNNNLNYSSYTMAERLLECIKLRMETDMSVRNQMLNNYRIKMLVAKYSKNGGMEYFHNIDCPLYKHVDNNHLLSIPPYIFRDGFFRNHTLYAEKNENDIDIYLLSNMYFPQLIYSAWKKYFNN